ncbi:ferrous iron transport protein B [Helicobacter muridarum]|uniref:Ferrous iron transport protein B n=1 Tax=Helicobacter muridarum TaxID=216 RepID=A0A099TVZ3_9HELI|nr:ferrous iron transport protein B [Helicobacter muridarum]TLE00481.1 ferrous iron transport protein B [Helicobacter muridarum]STQ86457.1 ferrous iron transport protein [Helicobacter muridarum]
MKTFSIVLVGQPNVGKSSLINAISGAKMRVGNFSGVTIQKSEATLVYKDYEIRIIDLPGTFSLNGYTMEEKICGNFLASGKYDLILNVVDSTSLERNLILTLQLKKLQNDIQKPIFVALNMIDEAQNDGLEINIDSLKAGLGFGVCAVSSTKEENLDNLLESLVSLYEDSSHSLSKLSNQQRILDPKIIKWSTNSSNLNSKGIDTSSAFMINPNPLKLDGITSQLASQAREIAANVQKFQEKRGLHTAKLDSILLDKFWSIPIFLLSMFIVFQISFVVGSFFQEIIEDGVSYVVDWSKELIEEDNELLGSLIGDGIINGVGTVVSFLPLIATLFLGLTLLEGSGYMSRVAFILDGLFFRFGLHGRSFIPLVMGFGCSVPAYMATRTLQNQKDKLLTLFIIGFMSCSARLPIYLLFVGAFFTPQYAGLVMFGIYIGGVIIAMFMALILKKLVFRGDSEPFVMDMPRYRMPTLKVIWFSVWSKSLLFLKKAGTVILAGAILVWALANFPKSQDIKDKYEGKLINIKEVINDSSQNLSQTEIQSLEESIVKLENEEKEKQLEYSFAGRLGHIIYPIFEPLGFDWRLSVSLITGFAAKEMVVTTLGVLYALGDSAEENEEDNRALQEILREHIALPGAVAFILFIMLYIPCFAATATFAYESGNKIYVAFLLIFTTLVAYTFAFIGHEVTELIIS